MCVKIKLIVSIYFIPNYTANMNQKTGAPFFFLSPPKIIVLALLNQITLLHLVSIHTNLKTVNNHQFN